MQRTNFGSFKKTVPVNSSTEHAELSRRMLAVSVRMTAVAFSSMVTAYWSSRQTGASFPSNIPPDSDCLAVNQTMIMFQALSNYTVVHRQRALRPKQIFTQEVWSVAKSGLRVPL